MKKVLVVTNEDDPHADAVIDLLGKNVFRLNSEQILGEFQTNILLSDSSQTSFVSGYGRKLCFDDISSVYYRRPEKPKDEQNPFDKVRVDEAWGALYHSLYGLDHLPWMGHPLMDKRNSSRLLQLKTANEVGFKIPETIISRDIKEIKKFVKKCEKVAVKPIHVRGLTKNKKWTPYFTEVIDRNSFKGIDDKVLGSTYNYIQKYIPKKREWRVTVVDNSIFPCVLESQDSDGAKEDWRKINYQLIKHYHEELPSQINKFILRYMKKLKMPFGAMDLIETPDGQWYFLECNPNGQWLWIQNLTNQPISNAIAAWHKKYF